MSDKKLTTQQSAINALQDAQDKTLAVIESRFTLSADEKVQGVEQLSREDISIPRLVLVQATTPDIANSDKHLGEWYNTLTGEFMPELLAVMMSESLGRACFPRKYSKDSEPECSSDNALTPRPEYYLRTITDSLTGIQATIDETSTCPTCPFSKFGEKSESPMCAKAYNYAMADQDGIPFLTRAQRTGTAAGKQINTVALLMGRRKMIRLSSRQETTDTGKYYVPVFAVANKTPADLLEHVAVLSKQFGNLAARASEEVKRVVVTHYEEDTDLPM